MKPNLKSWGILVSAIGIAILIIMGILDFVHDYYLLANNQNTLRLPSWLALIAGLLNLLGLLLILKGIDRTKQTPS
jgi:hypothetical protein